MNRGTPNIQDPTPNTLVTGGAGFLGSHMCDKLIAEGHQVICVDNLLTGSKENIAHLLDNENFTFIEHDVTQPIDLEALVANTQHPTPNTQDQNYVLHFASPASPKDYLKYPIETMQAGAFGTYNMLELVKEKGAVFLLASTSEVYGNPEVNPQSEDYWGHVNPIGPRSVYDEAKRYAEALTMAYYRTHKMDVRIVRIFNTYGPRLALDDGRVISNFIVQALKGEPITVYGDGTQTRSFCYVDDLIEGIYSVVEAADIGEKICNVGNPDEYAILDLAKLVKDITRSKSEIVFKPLPTDDPQKRKPDITKIKIALGWEPEVPLRDGLRETIEYFRMKVQL